MGRKGGRRKREHTFWLVRVTGMTGTRQGREEEGQRSPPPLSKTCPR